MTRLLIHFLFCGLALFPLSNNIRAQGKASALIKDTSENVACPKLYFGINVGLDNPNGFAGVSAMYPIVNHLSARTGLGWHTWGYQFFQELILYAGRCNTQTALSVGISYNTGRKNWNVKTKVTSFDSSYTEQLLYKFDPQLMTFINAYYFFNNGRRKNKFYVMLGGSFGLNKTSYELKSTTAIAPLTYEQILVRSPLGFNIGFGFLFNVTRRSRL